MSRTRPTQNDFFANSAGNQLQSGLCANFSFSCCLRLLLLTSRPTTNLTSRPTTEKAWKDYQDCVAEGEIWDGFTIIDDMVEH